MKTGARDGPLFLVTWDGAVLRPHTEFDFETASRYRWNVPLHVRMKEMRTDWRQRLYWAVLRAVVNATGRWPTDKALHAALKIKLGYIEEVVSLDGEILIHPESTAYGAMGEEDFRRYFDAAMEVLTTEVLPGETIDTILALGRARLKPFRKGPSS